jgi:hypothetical protein
MLNGLGGFRGFKMPSLIQPRISGLPAFASGGFVSGDSASASVSGGIDVTVMAAPGSAIADIKTRGGIRALKEVMSGRPGEFRAALGIP